MQPRGPEVQVWVWFQRLVQQQGLEQRQPWTDCGDAALAGQNLLAAALAQFAELPERLALQRE